MIDNLKRSENGITLSNCGRCNKEIEGFIGVWVPVRGLPVDKPKKLCRNCNKGLVEVLYKWWWVQVKPISFGVEGEANRGDLI